MYNFFYVIKQKISRFMYGRYGVDRLSRDACIVAFILSLILRFINGKIGTVLYFISNIILILSIARIFSKNIKRRYAENVWYLNAILKIKNWFNSFKFKILQYKNYHIYTCPNCMQKIRIPRGKGKIEITCPKCKAKFIKKS